MMLSGEFVPSLLPSPETHAMYFFSVPYNMCKACKPRNLKRDQGFWKEFWPPCAKDANDNQRHLGAEAYRWQIHGGAQGNPTGEMTAILRSEFASLLPALSAERALRPRAGGWPQRTQGCAESWKPRTQLGVGEVKGAQVQGPSLGRQLWLCWLQFLFSDDRMFPNSQPGVCKHL